MNDIELFELSKEVYKYTKWRDGVDFYFDQDDPEAEALYFNGFELDFNSCPLYTSDYLFSKLFVAEVKKYGTECKAYYPLNFGHIDAEADTPLKALLKLTVALIEAGELREEDKR